MYIHIVQPGDTIYTIADRYGISPERLSLENDIASPNDLIIGEALVIIKPSQTYIVQGRDSIESIAKKHGMDVMELLRNNPNISGRELYPGEELVISYTDRRTETIKTNGFAYPFIEKSTLEKTLPYLTYLTIYAYQLTRKGNLIGIDDSEIIQLAKAYGTAPVMFITAANEGNTVDTDIAHILVSDVQAQNTFINNILSILHNKGYYGVNINTPYIQPEDRQPYVSFIAKITELLNKEGFWAAVTIEPSTFEVSTGIIYQGVDYTGLSQVANSVLYQLTYTWSAPYGLPISILPFNAVTQTLDNAIVLLTPEKCILGISNVGYLWEFPYFGAETNTKFLNYNSAIELAKDTGSAIQFNEVSRSSYFDFIDNEHEYMAWFKDARAIYPLIAYSRGNRLQGISVWNIMYFVTNLWLLMNAEFIIEKV